MGVRGGRHGRRIGRGVVCGRGRQAGAERDSQGSHDLTFPQKEFLFTKCNKQVDIDL